MSNPVGNPAPAAAPVTPPPSAAPQPVVPDVTPVLSLLPQSTASMVSQDWFLNHPLDNATVGEHLDAQVRFRIEGNGPVSKRELVPETKNAALLLSNPEAAQATKHLISGLLATADGFESATKLTGIALATSTAGETLNTFISASEQAPPLPPYSGDSKAISGTYLNSLDTLRSATPDGAPAGATYDSSTGWLELNTQASRPILQVATGSQSEPLDPEAFTNTVTQSRVAMNQAITPLLGNREQFGWLDDGISRTLGTWPGAVGQSLVDLGMPPGAASEMSARVLSAPDPVSSLNKNTVASLLKLAGIRDKSAESYQAAQTLLQGPSATEVPTVIADRIVQVHGLGAGDAPALASRIVELYKDPDKVLQLERDILETAASLHPPAPPPEPAPQQ